MTTRTAPAAQAPAREHIVRSAGIIALGNIASRLLGLARDQITAGLFGRSGGADIFFVAANISQVFYDLLINGAVASALVPIFSSYGGESERARLWRIASLVLNLAVVVLSVVVLVMVVCAPQIVDLAGAGFSPELKRAAVEMTRITLLSVIFLGTSAVFTAILYSLQEFVFPAFCAALFNAFIIVSAVLFSSRMGVASLAVGMLLGAIAQVIFQLPPLVRRRLAYRLTFDWRDPELRRIVLLYAPVAAGFVVSGIQVFLDRNLASRTGQGSISAMQYATRLIQFPLGLIPTAIAGASLPVLARRAADDEGFRSTLASGLRLIIFLILPAAAGLAVLATPIVAAIFQHGAFGALDTERTARALVLYLPGLPAAAIDQILIFAFYARKNTLTPVLVGVLATGIYLAVALPLLGPLGMEGLVLANSAQWIGHALILFALLWRTMGDLGGLGLGRTLARTLLATGVMAAAVWLVTQALGPRLAPATFAGNVALIVTGAATGLGAFGGAAWALRMQEMGRLLTNLRRGKRPATDDAPPRA